MRNFSKKIRNIYANKTPSVKGNTNNATDTLVTKILLGTMGCVPAYDRYYVHAVKAFGISSGNYNRGSVMAIAHYYEDHREEFDKMRVKFSIRHTDYPPMKLMDIVHVAGSLCR